MCFYFFSHKRFSKWHFNYATLKVTKQWSDGATGIMYHLVTNVLLLDRCRLKAGQTPTGVDAVCAHLFFVNIQVQPRQHTHTHTLLRVKILNASLNMLASILPNIEHSIYLLVSDGISCVSHGWIGSDSSGKHGCDLIISSSMCLYLVFFFSLFSPYLSIHLFVQPCVQVTGVSLTTSLLKTASLSTV